MNLLIDIGNSRIKYAFVQKGVLLETGVVKPNDWMGIIKKNPENILISSVRSDTENVLGEIGQTSIPIKILNHGMKFPISMGYNTPNSLGMDRLAASIGAWEMSKGEPVLAVMMGTCITMDLVTSNTYQGGSISPGLQMRLRAMHDYTQKLPLLQPMDNKLEFPGKTTEESMRIGAIDGIKLEILGRISSLVKDYPNLSVFISGGDSNMFESSVNTTIFVAPDLIFVGLNRILEDNV